MRILLVDDEKLIRETLKEILEDEGFEVFTEESGSEVLKRLKEISPDVLILDLFLPGTSGMEVLRQMKEENLTEKVAVIIVSGHGTVETAVKAMKLGAFDFVEKPIKYEKFLKILNEALNKKKEERQISCDYSNFPLRQAKEKFEKDYIKALLKKFNGDLKKTASFMEIDISNLYRKLNKYGIDYD